MAQICALIKNRQLLQLTDCFSIGCFLCSLSVPHINVVSLGYTETDMTAQLDDAHRKKFIEQIPMHRFGTAKETAQLCVFLASDKAAYITSQTFVIDGGWTAK